MVRSINLLPWRDMQREQRRRLFFIKFLAVFLLSLLVLGTVYGVLQSKLSYQEARNVRLQKEINQLNQVLSDFSAKKVARDKLQHRLELVNALQKQRNNPTLLLNLLPKITPDGVVLDGVSLQDNRVTIEGRSHTNAKLASLLANLERSDEVSDVQIHSIINQDHEVETSMMVSADDYANQFRATFNLTKFVVPKFPTEVKNAG